MAFSSIHKSQCHVAVYTKALTMDLHWLALSLIEIKFDARGSCFSLFSHPTQPNASLLTTIKILLPNETQYMYAWKIFVWQHACTCNKACKSVWPLNPSLHARSTCNYLWVHLARDSAHLDPLPHSCKYDWFITQYQYCLFSNREGLGTSL